MVYQKYPVILAVEMTEVRNSNDFNQVVTTLHILEHNGSFNTVAYTLCQAN